MGNKNDVSDQIVQYVMSVTDEELTSLSVTVLAHSFKIDRYKLLRQFKRQTDMTLEHFLFKEKMDRAAFLLNAHKDITVKEVADRVGFCTCSYFIHKFRQYFGVGPGRYRDYKSFALNRNN